MAERFNQNLSKLNWSEARDLVQAVNPELAREIDELDPGDECALYHVRYPYGELIADQSRVTFPTPDGVYLPYQSPEHPSCLAEDLGYGAVIPAGLILKNTVELYCELEDRVKSMFTAKKGNVVGLFPAMKLGTALDKNNAICMTAGLRSLFMIAPIGDNIAHNRLMRAYDIHSSAPKKLLDQWHVFKEIVQAHELSWEVEVLFFSKQWFLEIKEKKWRLFRQFLFESIWRIVLRHSYYEFNELFLSHMQTQCNLRADPHLINTAHHLIYLGAGITPGYGVLNSEEQAPIEFLQQVYLSDYRLAYAPIMLGTQYFSEGVPVYYSLEVPTNIHSTIRSRKRITRIEELREVRRTMLAMQREILRNRLELEDLPYSIFHASKSTVLDYFHSEAMRGDSIRPVIDVLKVDIQMNKTVEKYNLPLCDTNRFFWGCVAVLAKNAKE